MSAFSTLVYSHCEYPQLLWLFLIGSQVRNDFTPRTKIVLSHLHTSIAKNSQEGLTMQKVLKHKTAIDASRWFFESLVLVTRGHIRMNQEEAYGAIVVSGSSAAGS